MLLYCLAGNARLTVYVTCNQKNVRSECKGWRTIELVTVLISLQYKCVSACASARCHADEKSCASVGRRAQWLIFEASQAGMSACWHSCLLAYFRNAWKSPSRAKEHALIHLDNVTGLGSWLTLCHAPTRGYNDRGKGKKKQMSWYNPQCFMGAFHICLWLSPSSSCCHNSHLLAGGTTITVQFWGGG